MLPDPFNNLTFGGILRSIDHGALKQMDDVTVGMETAVHAIDLVTTVYATQTGTSDEWVSSMRSLDSKTSSSAAALLVNEMLGLMIQYGLIEKVHMQDLFTKTFGHFPWPSQATFCPPTFLRARVPRGELDSRCKFDDAFRWSQK